MPLRNSLPYVHRPRGVSDTLDGGNSRPGSMRGLTNLMFDPSTPGCFIPRPAATIKSTFSGFTTPGVVSAAYLLGDIVYGMIGSQAVPGYDEPFAYHVPSNTFYAVTGVKTAATLPATQGTTGAWVPPVMDTSGIYMIVTHPGFPGGAGVFFGWLDITNRIAPVWNAGNTATNPLPKVPSSVIQFNSRFYFSVSNQVWYTSALTITIAFPSQVLTIGRDTDITAMAPFSLSTTTQGVLQGILVFKKNNISQITGDAAPNTLAINDLPESVGCAAPRSIISTPSGIVFMANDGIRRISLDGLISEPDLDLRVPFINAATPSRVSASYSMGIYRICLQNNAETGTPFQEWWLNTIYQGWTGPHTFRHDLMKAYGGSFIAFDTANPAKLYQSDVAVGTLTGYTENSVALVFKYTTSAMPDGDSLMANSSVASSISAAIPAGSSGLSLTALNDDSSVLSTAIIVAPVSTNLWGQGTWGVGLWYGSVTGLEPHTIPWLSTLVFSHLMVQIVGTSATGFKISNLRIIYQPLGYLP